jgi:hypothetical protein
MKVKISGVLAVFFILSLLPLVVNGQAPQKRYQLFLVVDEVVKPSMQGEYYNASKKWTSFMKDQEFPYPFDTYWTGDNHVYWSFPIENYADIDKITEAIDKIREKSPEDLKAIEDAFKGTYETYRRCVYALDYKYSMIAEEMVESEEDSFIFFDIYYLEPGYEAEINKIFEEMVAFMKDKEIIQSWYAYWGMMGTDNPVLVSAASAKNIREFWEENAKAWDALGKEAGKIKQKMMKYVRKQEQKMAWVQKELSYAPAEKQE